MLPVFLISAAVNPLFNHQGITLILYLKNGNPLTLESILYGLAAGVMLVSVLNWFSCYQVVMTSDKFIYSVWEGHSCCVPDFIHGASFCAKV